MKKILGLFTILVVCGLALALAQQEQSKKEPKADKTQCGRHTFQVERQKTCGDCSNEDCCGNTDKEQKAPVEKGKCHTKGSQAGNNKTDKPVNQPKQK